MRIVWDVTPLSLPATGIGTYIRESFVAAARLAPRHEWLAFSLSGPRGTRRIVDQLGDLPAAVSRRHLMLPGAGYVRRPLNAVPLPLLEALSGRADAFLGSEWFYPRQRRGRRAAIVYDLVPLRFPELTTPATRRLHIPKLRDVQRADVVFCISEATASDVRTFLHVHDDRIRVARPGVAERFRAATAPADPAGGRPYVLSVATVEPRKNLGTLLEAFARVRSSRPELALVLAGGHGPAAAELFAQVDALGLGGAVVSTGYVDVDRIPALLAGARAFCFPSLFEGFGMPVAEALAVGVPVVASDDPSLDEACGSTALRVPARDAAAMARAIEVAAFDEGERAARTELGREHVAGLTWEACAAAILRGLEEAA